MNILNSYLRKKEIVIPTDSVFRMLPRDSILLYSVCRSFIKRELYINNSMIYFLYYYDNQVVSSRMFKNDRCS